MKLIIAGSRHIPMDPWRLLEIMQALEIPRPELIIEGGCRQRTHVTVDEAAEQLAPMCEIPHKREDADWEEGKRIMAANPRLKRNPAGPIRNAKMAGMGDALLLIWDGKSGGSQSMKNEAEKRKMKIWEVICE